MKIKSFTSICTIAVILFLSGCTQCSEQQVNNTQMGETSQSEEYSQPIDDVSDEEETVVPLEITLEESLELKKQIDSKGSKVVVHNAVEFLMAIKSDRTIIIESEDTISLSPAILALKENGFCEAVGIVVQNDGFEDLQNDGLVFYDNYDGIGVAICGINNLTITSNKGAVIVSSPRYDDVLKFVRCKKTTLSNLVLGHTFEGYCLDGVVSIINSNSVAINDCDLYGCGTEGLIIDGSEKVNCKKVIVRDCSYYIMHVNSSKDVMFSDCNFRNNREFEQINVDENCKNITFDKCIIENNQGTLFKVQSDVVFRNCSITHNDEIGETANVKFDNTNIKHQ